MVRSGGGGHVGAPHQRLPPRSYYEVARRPPRPPPEQEARRRTQPARRRRAERARRERGELAAAHALSLRIVQALGGGGGVGELGAARGGGSDRVGGSHP